jgi:hypothetical protein
MYHHNLTIVFCVFKTQRRCQQNKQPISFDWTFIGRSDCFRTCSESP